MKVYQNITELIGRTPLLELKNYTAKEAYKARIFAKLEYFNPAGSVKDRIAYAMIADAEEKHCYLLTGDSRKVTFSAQDDRGRAGTV